MIRTFLTASKGYHKAEGICAEIQQILEEEFGEGESEDGTLGTKDYNQQYAVTIIVSKVD